MRELIKEFDVGSPAHAGMDLAEIVERVRLFRLPRTRGMDPAPSSCHLPRTWLPPHTRGWTLMLRGQRHHVEGSPAHAGMDRGRIHVHGRPPRLPRTRGDGPFSRIVTPSGKPAPRTRGDGPWRSLSVADLLTASPAHAGMDRMYHPSHDAADRLPRTRGDGPAVGLQDGIV